MTISYYREFLVKQGDDSSGYNETGRIIPLRSALYIVYNVITVPALPSKASTALYREVIIAFLPGFDFAKETAA